jgi:hypothetical protein
LLLLLLFFDEATDAELDVLEWIEGIAAALLLLLLFINGGFPVFCVCWMTALGDVVDRGCLED